VSPILHILNFCQDGRKLQHLEATTSTLCWIADETDTEVGMDFFLALRKSRAEKPTVFSLTEDDHGDDHTLFNVKSMIDDVGGHHPRCEGQMKRMEGN
jgi:hypothetical protein